MENRDSFLADIARQLGRDVRRMPMPRPRPASHHAQTRLVDLTAQQRCDAFIDVATNVMLAHCEVVPEIDAAQAAQRLCDKYGHAPVIISADPRLEALGITACLQRECQATVWDPRAGEENLRLAEQAKVGVVYAEYGLTESGGVVLFSAPERGRASACCRNPLSLSCARAHCCHASHSWRNTCITWRNTVNVCHLALILLAAQALPPILSSSRLSASTDRLMRLI